MIDVAALRQAILTHGRVARVVIASVEGSSPREAGASMLVWSDGQSGTIGGGALEWQAALQARSMLGPPPTPIPSPHGGEEALAASQDLARNIGHSEAAEGRGMVSGQDLSSGASPPPGGEGMGVGGAAAAVRVPRVMRIPLGPALGQCCGGAVMLVSELFSGIDTLPDDIFARSLDGRPMPLAVRRLLDRARSQGQVPAPTLLQGWLIEPVARPRRHLWIWGAGHVGRALVQVLAPLPNLAITWIDVAASRFPAEVPSGVTMLPASEPAALTTLAPTAADHLILTYSHALDLELCHRLLSHGFGSAGLIGSATKWARFRSRLTALGHAPQTIARIRCPIGDPALGKHPQAIAIGVASALLAPATSLARQESAG